MSLTQRGQAVLPVVRAVVTKYKELLAHLWGVETSMEVVRVAMGGFKAQLYLPSVLAGVREPAWRLETHLVRGRKRIMGVVEGHYDLALVTHDPLEVKRLTESHPVMVEVLAKHVVIVIAHRATAVGKDMSSFPPDRPVLLEKLARWPLVGLDEQSGLRRKLEQHLRGRAKLQYALEGHPGGWAMAREYARHRLGAALLPLPLLTDQDQKDFVVRRLPNSFVIEDLLIVPEGDRTPAQTEAIECFHRAAAALTRQDNRHAKGK